MTYLQQFLKDMNFDADRYFVGFDNFQDSMTTFAKSLGVNTTNYPPFNIKKIDENNYIIELAVAGFGKNDIKISMNDGVLTINGETGYSTSEEDKDYLYKGIGSRAFNRLFKLSDTIEVKDAHLVNGMLKIYLENMRKVSEKMIPITDKSETTKPQMLNE